MRIYVAKKLKKRWSPELIAGRLNKEMQRHRTNYESIYKYIYEDHPEYIKYLVRQNRVRKRRGQSKSHKSSHIPYRIGIDKRPKIVEKRVRFGDWETDTAVSRQSKSAMLIGAERKSRYIELKKLRRNGPAENNKKTIMILKKYPKRYRLTITRDNGKENVWHQEVNKKLGTKSYFTNPYHSWEKGLVENRIGVVRIWLPKKTDFAKVSTSKLKRIQDLINDRPMKVLKFKTPKEVFCKKTGCCT